jgi:hypothetical protein
MNKLNFTPIIIVGAPRSGTNMLRDVLCQLDGINTWPCDEINYIWRHGNVRCTSDEFSKSMARPQVISYIRNKFRTFALKTDSNFVVEKTCATSLRVPFVEEILPEAKYIFIVRDGLDVVGSARLRWKAALDLDYILKKVRFIPFLDIPFYGIRYLANRVYKFVSREKRLSYWGPQFSGLEEALKKHSLEEVCALQWQACVESAENAFLVMPKDKVMRVRYEDFVKDPRQKMSDILDFIGNPLADEKTDEAVRYVSLKSVGKGRSALGGGSREEIEHLVSGTLRRYGYL